LNIARQALAFNAPSASGLAGQGASQHAGRLPVPGRDLVARKLVGDLVLQGKDGNVEPFLNVQSGYLFLASPKRVMEATTAEDLVGQP
jgi:hypothetical protein